MLHEVRWFAEAKLSRQRLRFQLLRAIFSWVHRFLTTAVPGGRVVVHALFTRLLDRRARKNIAMSDPTSYAGMLWAVA
jgi:hypothetical protein